MRVHLHPSSALPALLYAPPPPFPQLRLHMTPPRHAPLPPIRPCPHRDADVSPKAAVAWRHFHQLVALRARPCRHTDDIQSTPQSSNNLPNHPITCPITSQWQTRSAGGPLQQLAPPTGPPPPLPPPACRAGCPPLVARTGQDAHPLEDGRQDGQVRVEEAEGAHDQRTVHHVVAARGVRAGGDRDRRRGLPPLWQQRLNNCRCRPATAASPPSEPPALRTSAAAAGGTVPPHYHHHNPAAPPLT